MHRAKIAFVNRLSSVLAEAVNQDCRECCFELTMDACGEEDVMHVYAWFRATAYHRSGGGKITVRPGQASPSVYLGSLHA